jgi:hypothetical protein
VETETYEEEDEDETVKAALAGDGAETTEEETGARG